MNSKDENRVIRLIKDAFTSTQYPGDKNIGRSHEGEKIQEDFRGKHWREVPIELLFRYRGDLSYFTPDAFRFYLPAFMLAVLLYENEVDTLPNNLILTLTPPAVFQGRWPKDKMDNMMKHFLAGATLFTPQEVLAIIDFLETYTYLHSEAYIVKQTGVVENAIAFWKSR